MSPEIAVRLERIEARVAELEASVVALAERMAPEPEDPVASGYARFRARLAAQERGER